MQSRIESIILLNDKDEKRFVDFNDGVNIITGESKTGKSALVEIIDYCLCSSRSTIPKGKITDFATLFSLILIIDNERYIIARKSTYLEKKKMLFLSLPEEITCKTISRAFFTEDKFHDYKIVQKQIERVLNLRVSNVTEDPDDRKEAASLRHMTSYLFQHQNLMASKFALFYRFDDYQKKKDVIQQFPIFAGIVGQEYYSVLLQLNSYKKELKKIQANQVSDAAIKNEVIKNLLPKVKNYYALIGVEFIDNLSLEKLIELANNLPTLNDNSYTSNEIVVRYEKIKQEIEELRSQEQLFKSRLIKLESASDNSVDYISSLEKLNYKSELSIHEKKDYNCPLCGSECTDLHQISREIEQASSWLTNEIHLMNQNSSHFAEEHRKITDQMNQIIKEIRRLWGQMRSIERNYLSQSNRHDLEKKLNYCRLEIQLYLETKEKGLFNNLDKELEDIQNKINECNLKLGQFNLEEEKKIALKKINQNMNLLKAQLDFEEEFKQYQLVFNLEEFELALVGKDGEKVTLSEMGSGANWVSCHIALFLSLLRYFTSQGSRSPMPLFMFFDQPSQVYFPQDAAEKADKKTQKESEKDKLAVTKMYKVMFDEIEKIFIDTKIKPQLIVVDHVDFTSIRGDKERVKFSKSTRRTWRNGKALI
ncbi:DUF3732 domain-containing protein [Paenibacillus tritici]|uniref:DUF3732 domain-containing protein n=1 Tax=Paenibacillus tritici TaxID=1873425 RepID=UPI001BACB2D3|nr:DUF3732 domain-containing protein [Paenibacillus tritici]QUL53369.1 DUF3732 domain-containing protein [Paenibacillus tritici]